jgi:(S)-3,5-dihydroxyphenylglycine transaminase
MTGMPATLDRQSLHASVRDPLLETMNFLNEITARYPDAISFAPGRPYEGFFDVEDVFTHLRIYLDQLAATGAGPEDLRRALFQYGPTAGQIGHLIAEHLAAEEDIRVPAEAIVVTVGCQEAMLLVLRTLFARPEDVLVVSAPCYVGITGAARLLDIRVAALPESDAPVGDALPRLVATERAAGRNPRACYVVPDVSNPTGTTMSLPARHRLLAAAERLDLLILEDSPYRLFTGQARLPTLKALDTGRRVVHLGSFAKSAFPGARTGFVVADQEVVDRDGTRSLLAAELAKVKSMVTVNTPSLSQAVIGGMLIRHDYRLSEANAAAAAHYVANIAATRAALGRQFPPQVRDRLGVSWNDPGGGFFLTLRVPFPADDALLATSASEYGVIWTPMAYFQPGGDDHAIRLACSYLDPKQIDEGVARLARLVRERAR